MATVAAETPNLRPLGIGEILDVAIKVYTRNAGTLFRLVAIVIIPVQVIGLFVILSTIPDAIAEAQQNPLTPDPNNPVPTFDAGDIGVFFAAYFVVGVLSFVGVTLATGACFKAISDAYLGVQPQWRTSLRYALRHLRSLIWVTFLVGLVSGLALLLCIAPGVWLWAAFAVATPALLTEGTRGTKAINRSFNLVKGRWWATFAVLLLAFLLASVVNGVVGGGVGALAFTDLADNVVLIQSLNAIATTIASVIATPFQAAVVAVLYFDLRVRKEGFDLQLLAQRMGTDTPEGPRAALIPPPLPPAYFAPAPGALPQVLGGPPPSGTIPGQEGVPAFPPPAYQGQAAYQGQQTNGFAIASLVSGILWIFWIGSIVALVFGYMGKRQIDASGGTQTGRGVAIAGIVLGWIGIATLVLTIIAVVTSQ